MHPAGVLQASPVRVYDRRASPWLCCIRWHCWKVLRPDAVPITLALQVTRLLEHALRTEFDWHEGAPLGSPAAPTALMSLPGPRPCR